LGQIILTTTIMGLSNMLGKRFDNDGKPTLKLNQLQARVKQQVDSKVAENRYVFEKVPCAICTSNDFETLSLKDRYGLYMPVVICKDCGLIQTNPRMSQESYNEFYNVEYRKLYGGQETPTNEFLVKQYGQGRLIYRYVEKYLNEKSDGCQLYVVEIGCGAGGILKYFYDKGCRVKGLDLGEEYIAYGKSVYGFDLSVGTASSLDVNDRPDLIIYSHVLEHILDPKSELEVIRQFMREGSMLYIEVPGIFNLAESYKYDFLRMMQNAHVYHFSLATLKNLMSSCGYSFISGDEKIRSLFEAGKSDAQIHNEIERVDYRKVMHHLRRVEFIRRVIPVYPNTVKYSLRRAVVLGLKKLGIYSAVKKGVWRLFG